MYETFYGLTGKPFQLTPDPTFFFRSRGHGRAMAYLKYGVHQAEGFIVITGEVGSGKTTLVRNLLQQLPTQGLVAVQLVSTQLDANDILRMVAGAFFGVVPPAGDKAGLILSLERYFRKLHTEGKRALLVVDEAQNLTPSAVEELRMLSNFQTGNKSLLQSLLLGQPEFRDIMQRPEMRQLRQRVTASAHLGPLEPEETKGYIEHRLGRVGWTNKPRFEPEAYRDIHEFSEGIPRQINILCDRLLLAGYLGEKTVLESADVREIFDEFRRELGGFGEERGVESIASGAAKVNTGPQSASSSAAPEEIRSNGVATEASSGLEAPPEGVVLAGMSEQVGLMQQSLSSMTRVLNQLMQIARPGSKPGKRDV